MHELQVILERKSSNDKLWGRVPYDDEFIVVFADDLEGVLAKIRAILTTVHRLKSEQLKFAISYDLTALFKEKSFLNLSAVAKRLGMNRSLLNQYATGKKFTSAETAKKIEEVLHSFGHELTAVRIAPKSGAHKRAISRETV